MFRKLHIQLTFFFTLVSGLILAAMTGVCLYFSQNSLTQNSYSTFLTSVSSVLSYLEAQTVIPHRWLLQQETNNHFSIKILDNQQELFFSRLEEDSGLAPVYRQAMETAQEDYELNLDSYSAQNVLAQHVEFQMDGTNQKKYYVSAALLPRKNGFLSVTILYPLDLLQKQLSRQRFLFLAADLAGILCLAAFSWFYTRRLLKPIEDNRNRQTQFIASASHELRTPLAVIRSSLSALKTCQPQQASHFCQIMDEEVGRMSHLIQDMLSLANADNHSWGITPAPAELDTLLLNLYEHYEPLARQREHLICVRLPDAPCPPCLCDQDRIRQVLSVFIDNALAYTPKGCKITLSLEQEANAALLTVSDDGPGIPDDEKAAVFQRFYRCDPSRHAKGHYGLGLSIAYEIAQLHRGSIQLQDVPGGGAAFILTLPLSSQT